MAIKRRLPRRKTSRRPAHEALSAPSVGLEASYSLIFDLPGPPPVVTLALEALSLWSGSASPKPGKSPQNNECFATQQEKHVNVDTQEVHRDAAQPP